MVIDTIYFYLYRINFTTASNTLKMSREIKFRAWDKEKKQMISLRDFDTSYAEGAHLIFGCEAYDHCYPDDVKLLSEYELMQFTGLKDKNGKEIYEGDIVRCGNYQAEIIFNKNIASFRIQYTALSGNLANDVIYGHDWEVIGNVFENTELLK